MPSRWLVPLEWVDAERVELAHVHAAISGWFDHTSDSHKAELKPYSISPLRTLGPGCAVEVGLLTATAEVQLGDAAIPGCEVRLGRRFTSVAGSPQLLLRQEWHELARCTTERAWSIRFETPASFRQGGRTTPLPTPAALLRGLGEKWSRWSGLPPRDLSPRVTNAVWVSDLHGASEVVPLGRGDRRVHYSGFVGRVRYQCDDGEAAASVGPLFALANFAGVGSATTKGLGVSRLEPTWRPAGQQNA